MNHFIHLNFFLTADKDVSSLCPNHRHRCGSSSCRGFLPAKVPPFYSGCGTKWCLRGIWCLRYRWRRSRFGTCSLLFYLRFFHLSSFLYLTSITIPFPTQFRLVRVKLWDGIHQRPSLSWKRKPAQQHTKPVTTRAYVKIYFTAQIKLLKQLGMT